MYQIKLTTYHITQIVHIGALMNRSFIVLAALATVPTNAFAATLHMDEVQSSHHYTTAVVQNFTLPWSKPEINPVDPGNEFVNFCNGTADLVTSFRLMTNSEKRVCEKNGIIINQNVIGYEIVSFAMTYRKSPSVPFIFTQEQIAKALSKPRPMWSDIDSSLPHTMIEFYGLNQKIHDSVEGILSTKITTDAWIDAGNDNELAITKISTSPDSIGVFSYSFVMNNLDKLHPLVIGEVPSIANVQSGAYPFLRPFIVFHNGRNGSEAIATEFASTKASGPDGYLVKLGLVPRSN